ncbi:MAG: SAM-dependent methyltransferase, partial [Stenotrophomonas acidaminiphila]
MNQIVDVSAAPSYGALDRLLRSQLLARLDALDHGVLVVSDALGEHRFGAPGEGALPTVHLWIDDPAFYRAVAAQGSVGAGESWIEGQWRCDDLVGLVRLLVRNRALLDGMEGGLARLGGWALRSWHALRRNTREGSRRNIAAHYDLGNDFFA